MILVLLGTQNNSFFRLLDEIQNCISSGLINEEVVVQSGHTSYHSDKMKILDFIPQMDLEKLIIESNYIITHGGVGSIISSIKSNKKVIAVSRLSKYNEHVNDHQIQIVNKFNDDGYIIGLNDACLLKDGIEKINTFIPKKYYSNTKNILNIVSNYIDNN